MYNPFSLKKQATNFSKDKEEEKKEPGMSLINYKKNEYKSDLDVIPENKAEQMGN